MDRCLGILQETASAVKPSIYWFSYKNKNGHKEGSGYINIFDYGYDKYHYRKHKAVYEKSGGG